MGNVLPVFDEQLRGQVEEQGECLLFRQLLVEQGGTYLVNLGGGGALEEGERAGGVGEGLSVV